jgi:hypothetical protein
MVISPPRAIRSQTNFHNGEAAFGNRPSRTARSIQWLGACASIHEVAYPAAESAAHARVPARQNCVVHLSSAGGIGERFEVQLSKVFLRRVNSKDGELCVNPVR